MKYDCFNIGRNCSDRRRKSRGSVRGWLSFQRWSWVLSYRSWDCRDGCHHLWRENGKYRYLLSLFIFAMQNNVLKVKSFFSNCTHFWGNSTAWKVSVFEVFSGPYFPAFGLNFRMRENTDQNNSEYGVFYAVLFSLQYSETHSEPSKISTMELLAKIVNGWYQSAKNSSLFLWYAGRT